MGQTKKHDNALGQRLVLISRAQIAMEFDASLQVQCLTLRKLAFTHAQYFFHDCSHFKLTHKL